MKKLHLTRALLAFGVLGVFAVAGCELAVDFDRTLIDSGTFDASIGETSVDAPITPPADAQGDVAVGDGSMTMDTGIDSPVDDSGDSGATTADADDGSDGADE